MLCEVSQLPNFLEKKVIVRGWVGHKRKSGKIRFMTLRDGSAVVQLVFSADELSDGEWASFSELKQESSVVISGVVRNEPRAPGGVELLVNSLEIVQIPEQHYPVTHKEHGPDFLLTHRHLWIRSRKQAAILRIRHMVSRAIRSFLDEQGFVETSTPILTPNACEGTTDLFTLPYFDLGDVYLSQSGQLYGEALAMALGKVYTFTPAFRAERSKTRKHLTEFWMMEPEMAWYDRDMTLELIESLIKHIVQMCLDRCESDLHVLERDTSALRNILAPFKRMTYKEALSWLNERGRALNFGDNLGAEDEVLIGESHEVPVFITGYPAKNRAFYMKLDDTDPDVVLDMDLIAPEGFGEIVGGSQREEKLDVLKSRLKDHGLPQKPFEWYFDLRRYGSVPHSGFGLGLERTVAWICGAAHIRECIPFPRMLYRIQP